MFQRLSVIEIEIEFQHVHSWLTKKPKLSAFCVCRDDLTQLLFTHSTFTCDARHLKFSRSRRDVRIESGAGGRHEIDRHRLAGILCLQLLDVRLYAIDQAFDWLGQDSSLMTRSRRNRSRPRPTGVSGNIRAR